MKNWLKENWFRSSLILVIILVSMNFSYSRNSKTLSEEFNNNVIRFTPDSNWKNGKPPYSNSVVCTLKGSANAIFSNEDNVFEIKSSLDEKPTTLTFIDLDKKTPSIIGNLGDKTELNKIDLGNQLYLMEQTPIGNVNIFTLFRDSNVMLLSKQYDLLGTPFGLLMIGECFSGN